MFHPARGSLLYYEKGIDKTSNYSFVFRLCLSDGNKHCPQVQCKIPSGQHLAQDGH